MKTIIGVLALAIAIPAGAQSAPAADPHAGHGQHQQAPKPTAPANGHAGMTHMDHAKMMAKCKDPAASAEMKAHCAAMMKEHGQHAPASTPPAPDHSGHAH